MESEFEGTLESPEGFDPQVYDDAPGSLKRQILVSSIAIIGIVLFFGFIDGSYLFKQYVKPWEPYAYQQYDDIRSQTVAHGILAYSKHNLQPWRVVYKSDDSTSYFLYVDTTRAFRNIDPYARRATFDQGVFLEYAVTGAERIGLSSKVELFPDGEYDIEGKYEDLYTKPVAKIMLGPGELSLNTLYKGIYKTSTSLTPYNDAPVPSRLENFFERLNDDSELRIQLVSSEDDVATAREMIQNGISTENSLVDSLVKHRVFRTNEYQKNEFRDGYTLDAFGPWAIWKSIWQTLRTIIPLGRKGGRAKVAKALIKVADSAPAFLLISARGNGRLAQVNAGRLFGRIQMSASQMGLTIIPMAEVIGDYPEMFEPYVFLHREFAVRGYSYQMVAAVGYQEDNIRFAPRRNPQELIEYVMIEKPKQPKQPADDKNEQVRGRKAELEREEYERLSRKRRILPPRYKIVPH